MKLLTLMLGTLLTTTIVFPLTGLSASASAGLPKYGLRTWQAEKRTLVRVYNLKTKQTIWTHSYSSIDDTDPDNGKFFWSYDRRAVAFSADGEATHSAKRRNKRYVPLVVWRAGERVRTVFYQPVPVGDYTEDMTWSPNDNYLVIRDGGSGMADTDLGNMSCLDINNQRTYTPGPSVGKPTWVSLQTIKFWQPDFSKQQQQGIVKASQPSFWTVPHIGTKTSRVAAK